jgi:8-oxo-dGTP pyrophosphatase MutT (NUDIX family)
MLDFDPNRQAVTPRDAATVVVVRPATVGIEVFAVKRHARSGFMGGALVFPGGKVDAADRSPGWALRSTPLSSRALSLASDPGAALGFAIAALRELLEEAAILPVTGGELDAEAALALRAELTARTGAGATPSEALLELLQTRGLSADAGRLEPLSRWITPAAETRRYDTRFYLMPLPERQSGRHDEHETTMSLWKTPAELLELWARGEVFLAPPTSRTLDLLSEARDVDDAIAIARAHPLDSLCPFFTQDGDQVVLALPGDPLYPEAAPAPADPRAPTRFVMEAGRFVPRRP